MNRNASLAWRTGHMASALAAALVMAVGMGFGRFAFTGIYPAMVSDGLLTVHTGTLAAAANYAGYLLGALAATIVHPAHSRRMCLWSLAIMVVCLAFPSLLHSPWSIIAARGLTGAVSALAMVAASLWLLQHRAYIQGAPLIYGGVGLGIVLSSELLAVGHVFGLHSQGLWLALAVGALALSAVAMPFLNEAPDTNPALPPSRTTETQAIEPLSARRLISLYGLAGFGYIITATYLPLIVKGAVGSIDPIQIWALYGLGAMPSCFVWHAIHMRVGTRSALFFNLALQGIGVMLPVLSPTAAGCLGSALVVGGSFMGTVTIAMLAARHVAHSVRTSIMAAMTASFGVGQIVGPLVAGALHAQSHSFSTSLLVAGAALLIAATLCVRFAKSPTTAGENHVY